jgi:uncharacterized RDD family membrane protein YckC
MMHNPPSPEEGNRPEALPSEPILNEQPAFDLSEENLAEAAAASPVSFPSESPVSPEGLASEPESGAGSPLPPPPFQPAGFIRRGVAFVIDLGLIYFLYFLLWIVGIVALTGSVKRGSMIDEILSPPIFPLFVSVWFFLFVGYFTFFHSYDGQTPAKMIVRIKVITKTGETLSPFRAFWRTLGYFVSGPLLWGLGFLMTLFDRKSRALHDRIARSLVVLA